MGLLSMSVVNAYQAFNQPWASGQKMSKDEFIDVLATKLIHNDNVRGENPSVPKTPQVQSVGGTSEAPRISCKYVTYQNCVTRNCVICNKKVHYFCTCGDAICNPQPSRTQPTDCFVKHVIYRV